MSLRLPCILLLTISLTIQGKAQSLFTSPADSLSDARPTIKGSVGSWYYGRATKEDNLSVPGGYASFMVDIGSNSGTRVSYNASLRYLAGGYGGDSGSELILQSAYATWKSPFITLSAGHMVNRWGRGEFSSPVNMFNPRDDLARTISDSDRDMGNIIFNVVLKPVSRVSLELTAAPLYRSSVLAWNYLDLPGPVEFQYPQPYLYTGTISYGVKGNIFLPGFDLSVYWYDGNNPMPLLSFVSYYAPGDDPAGDPVIEVGTGWYRNRMAAFDAEAILGRVVLRTGGAYTSPTKTKVETLYKPFSQADWFTNFEYSTGNTTLIIEYSGRYIDGFTEAPGSPHLLLTLDPGLLPPPGDPMSEAMITGALNLFNRFYLYQYEKSYHSAGTIITQSSRSGNLRAEFAVNYNITTREIVAMPSITWKPADNISLYAGFEHWSGPDNSLFDIIGDELNCFVAGIKTEFSR